MLDVGPSLASFLLPGGSIAQRMDEVPHCLVESRDVILNVHVAHGVAMRRIYYPRMRPHSALPSNPDFITNRPSHQTNRQVFEERVQNKLHDNGIGHGRQRNRVEPESSQLCHPSCRRVKARNIARSLDAKCYIGQPASSDVPATLARYS